ncbi:MAG: hypothetical protein LUC83_08470 [Clostridiales bacterium]|nr:hypothetical protein [Clostridiales bacterium]
MFKNNEGYADPTAGAAMSQLMKEYRQEQKKRYEIKNRPKVYIASRYAGDIEKNTADAAKACRYAAANGKIPVASHLMYPNMGFDDSRPMERELCLLFGLALLAVCDEVWCFTVDGGISAGMENEISEAKRLHIPVRYFDMAEVRA